MVTARILEGRPETVKQEIADTLFAALEAGVAAVPPDRGLALALDVVEIEPATFRKRHNLDRIGGRG